MSTISKTIDRQIIQKISKMIFRIKNIRINHKQKMNLMLFTKKVNLVKIKKTFLLNKQKLKKIHNNFILRNCRLKIKITKQKIKKNNLTKTAKIKQINNKMLINKALFNKQVITHKINLLKKFLITQI